MEIHSPRASVGHRQCPSLALRALRQIDCGRVGAAPSCGRQHRVVECLPPRDQSGEVIQTTPGTRVPTRSIRDGVVDSSPGVSVQRAGEDPTALSKTSATLTDDHAGNARCRCRSSPPHGASQRLSLTAMGFGPAAMVNVNNFPFMPLCDTQAVSLRTTRKFFGNYHTSRIPLVALGTIRTASEPTGLLARQDKSIDENRE